MKIRECLILFTRYPEAGTTKTRLIPRLGRRGAADLQRRMTVHALIQAAPLTAERDLALEVRYEGGGRRAMRGWLGEAATYRRQGGGDIGRRMARACRQALARGCESVVLFGSDIPGITTPLLKAAFEGLDDETIVLGPAADGGYYLIGLRRHTFARAGAALFEEMAWGTSVVLAETCRRIERYHFGCRLLKVLDDIDRPEDLPVWERFNPDA